MAIAPGGLFLLAFLVSLVMGWGGGRRGPPV